MYQTLRLWVLAMLCGLAGTASQAWAFSCASGATVGSQVTIVTVNATTSCASGRLALFSPAEFAAYQKAIEDIAALSAVVAANPPQEFDPLLAASFWSFAMTFVLGCWLLAKNAGTIINAIKRW